MVIGRRSWILALFLALLLVPPAWAEDIANDGLARSVIRVGVYQDPPLVFEDADGRYQGIYVDVIEHVAQQEGWRLRYVPGDWQTCLQRLETGEIDLLTAIAISPERQERFYYGDETVLINWGQVYALESSSLKGFSDLEGKSVAMLRDDIYPEGFLSAVDSFGVSCEPVWRASYDLALAAVPAGEADYALVPRTFGVVRHEHYGLEATALMVHPVELRFAGRRDGRGRALLDTIDVYVAQMHEDHDSVYHASLDRWLGQRHEEMVPAWIWWAAGVAALLVVLAGVGAYIFRRQAQGQGKALRSEAARRRRLERALEDSQERLRLLFANVPVVMLSIDRRFRLLDVSPSVEAVTGYRPLELTGRHLTDLPLLRESNWPAIKALLERVFAGDDGALEIDVRAKDGRALVVRFDCGPLAYDGQIAGAIATARDITEWRRAEREMDAMRQQLYLAQRLESVALLAGGVAHDFNNQLTPISGYVELAMAQLDEDAPIYDDLAQVRAAAEQARALTRQLQDIGRQSNVELEPLAVNELVQELLEMMRRVLPSQIRLEAELADDLWTVQADAGRIHQALMNLVVNARDALPEGGHVVVRTENVQVDQEQARSVPEGRPGRFVRISVIDDGMGMSSEVQQHLFEPFFTTKSEDEGTGLGLATSYGIVKLHEGWINVYSELGQGSVFRIYLPAAGEGVSDERAGEEAGQPARRAMTEADRAQAKTRRVLLVEDEQLVRGFAERVLDRAGYAYRSAAGVTEAQTIWRHDEGRFDLLLTDVGLPDGNGRELAQALCAKKPELVVLYSTGHVDRGILGPLLEESGGAVLQKPYGQADLLDAVARALAEVKRGE